MLHDCNMGRHELKTWEGKCAVRQNLPAQKEMQRQYCNIGLHCFIQTVTECNSEYSMTQPARSTCVLSGHASATKPIV